MAKKARFTRLFYIKTKEPIEKNKMMWYNVYRACIVKWI